MRIAATRLLSLWIAGWCLSIPAQARPAIDTVVMKNGDRFTCEVKRLDSGVLQVNLDYVDGTISVQWSQVARLESNQLFIIQTQDGATYTGKLGTAEAGPGEPLRLEIVSEEEKSLLEATNVVDVAQTSRTFLNRLGGSISLGTTYSKGNNATQYNVASDVDYRRARWSAEAAYQSNLAANKGAETTTRNQLDLTVNRLLPRKQNYFFFGWASFLQSSVQGISLQSSAGGGIGRYLKHSNQFIFSVSGGLAGQNTKYMNADGMQPNEKLVTGLLSADLRAFKFKRTSVSLKAVLLPSISPSDRVFFRTNATYYIKLFSNLTWNFSFYGSWDTKPPAQFSGSDYGAAVGVGWKFNR